MSLASMIVFFVTTAYCTVSRCYCRYCTERTASV